MAHTPYTPYLPHERQNTPLAALVRQRRAELGVSQSEIARRLGCTSGTVSRIEFGDRGIAVRKIPAWADVLGVPESTLALAVCDCVADDEKGV